MKTQGTPAGAWMFGERQKLAVMACLVAVGLLLWGRLLLLHRQPRQAVANTVASAASVNAADARGGRKVVRVELPGELARDLFALDASGYEPVPAPAAPEAKSAPAPTVERVEKSVDENADEIARVEAIRHSAMSLRLISTMQGASPRAVINGLPLAEGQVIKGFVLRKIHARQVILVKDGVEIGLEM